MSIHTKILESRDRADRMLAAARFKAQAANVSPAPMVGDAGMYSDGGARKAHKQYGHLWGHQYTAISAIAKRIAGQRLFVAREMDQPRGIKSTIGDECEPLADHAFLRAMIAPNPVMVQWSLLWSTVASLNATGRAFWLFAEDQSESGWDVWPIPSHWIEPGDPFRRTWKIRFFDRGEPKIIPGEFIAPFILPDPSDPLGSISPLQTQALAIDVDESIQQSQAASFQNGGRPGMVVTVGQMPVAPGAAGQIERPTLTPDQRTQLINAVRRAYSTAFTHGEPLIVDGAIESVTPYAATPSEMDWLASGKQTKGRIFEGFGVHSFITGEQAPGSYSQMAAVERLFCSQVINPLLTLMSQVLTRWAAPLFAAPDERLRIWFEEATADDPDMKLKRWQFAATSGFVDGDEFRTGVLNLPARPKQDDGAANPDVQTALNGSQIASLVAIAERVNMGDLSREAAAALIAASFPQLTPQQIANITNALEPGSATDADASAAAVKFAKQLNPYTLGPMRDG